jgi:ectoine hydroxylase-related dioxygenase (phytanoyl-CoA dioxygenase family)
MGRRLGWWADGSLFISVLVSIGEATVGNGCLGIAPLPDRDRHLEREWRPYSEEEIKEMPFVPVPTKPGDVVFFDSYVPHGSYPNLSDKRRRILYVTYDRASEGDQRARYYADKRKSFPPDCEREAGKEYVFRV